VPPDAPPTGELVAWAVKVYFYSALCQFREILRATLLVVNANHISAVFSCCRGLFDYLSWQRTPIPNVFTSLDDARLDEIVGAQLRCIA